MINDAEEKRRQEILKSIKKARRRSFKYIEWKILGFVLTVILLFSISFQYKAELERFLNPIYYQGAEHNQIISIKENEIAQLKVLFIDVGCADATFIEFPNGKTMLIDCAGDLLETTNSINALMRYLEIEIYSHKQNKVLDYLVVSHPDRDHYAGAKSVFREYEVQNIVRPIVLSESEYAFYSNNGKTEIEDSFNVKYDLEYEEFISCMQNEMQATPNCKMLYGVGGLDLSCDGVDLKFIAPLRFDYGEEWNNYSPCIRLEYNNKIFLFTADTQEEIEKELIDEYAHNIGYLRADILKMGHHGSETSSSNNFLNAVRANYYVASTRNGVYSNVPSKSVLTNIKETFPQAEIFRTDINGNVIFAVTNEGNLAIYSTRGAFDFITSFVYINLYYVLICISIMLYILIFQFRGTTRADILEMRRKKREKEIKKAEKERKKKRIEIEKQKNKKTRKGKNKK